MSAVLLPDPAVPVTSKAVRLVVPLSTPVAVANEVRVATAHDRSAKQQVRPMWFRSHQVIGLKCRPLRCKFAHKWDAYAAGAGIMASKEDVALRSFITHDGQHLRGKLLGRPIDPVDVERCHQVSARP